MFVTEHVCGADTRNACEVRERGSPAAWGIWLWKSIEIRPLVLQRIGTRVILGVIVGVVLKSPLYLKSEHGVARVDLDISGSCHCQGCSLKSNKFETLSSFHKQSTHLRRLGGSLGELPRHRLAQDGDNTHKNLVS